MTPIEQQGLGKFPLIAGLLLAGALAAGAIFAGWANYSDAIFITMLQDGMSWCF